jgi:hypothetical protein
MLAAMESDQKKGSGSFWSPEADENQIRFLPPVKANGEVLPYFHHKVHWIDGTPYECLAQTFTDKNGNVHEAEHCPACKISKKFYKIGERDSEEREIAYDLSGKDRYIFRIVDRAKDEATQPEPEFYEVGPTIFKKFFGVMKGGKYGNIVHPLEGRDFIIDKQGTGRRTNYDNSMPDPNITKIFDNKEDLERVLTSIKEMPYSDLIEFPSASTLKEAVEDYLNPDGKEEEEETKVKPTAKRASTKKVSEPVAEPEPEEEEEANVDDVDSILNEFV